MNQQVHGLLQKEVSRKEFLGIGGLALASLFGAGTLIKLVTGKSLGSSLTKHTASSYGASAYGGSKQ